MTDKNNQPGLADMQSAAEVIERLAKAAGNPFRIDGVDPSASFVLVPNGYQLRDLTEDVYKTRPAPARKKGTVTALSLESFKRLVADQNEGLARIYVEFRRKDPQTAAVAIAVLNDTDKESDAGWRDHRIVYQMQYSPEFAEWLAADSKDMTQNDFAEFIEEHIQDIDKGEQMLQVALQLQAKTDIAFESAIRLDNGQVQFKYSEEIVASVGKTAMTVPREFDLGIRLFDGDREGFRLQARLKYRLAGRKLTFRYELIRPSLAIEVAVKEKLTTLADLNVPVFDARP